MHEALVARFLRDHASIPARLLYPVSHFLILSAAVLC
jgi:hypothetical protein